MPKGTVREESEYRLPSDVLFTGRLSAVKEKTVEFNYKAHHAAVKNGKKSVGEKGEIHKWVWVFTILNDGEFYGQEVELETDPGVSTKPDDRGRQIYETLGVTLEIGDDIDTDTQVVGLPCQFTVAHQEPRERSDGKGKFYGVEIADVFPAPSAEDKPPF